MIIPFWIKLIVVFWIVTKLLIWGTAQFTSPYWKETYINTNNTFTPWIAFIGLCVLTSKILVLPFILWLLFILV